MKGKKRDPDHVGRGLLAVEIRSDPKLVMMSAWKLWAGSLSFLFLIAHRLMKDEKGKDNK